MATTKTLAELEENVRERADMQNSQFVSSAEVRGYINNSAFELYDLLIKSYGENYYVSQPYALVTNGSTGFYNLPADFYKLLGVDMNVTPTDENSYITLKPFNFSERNNFKVSSFVGAYGSGDLRYRLQGNQLWLNPLPAAGLNIRLWYIPRMVRMLMDSSTLDGISGWDEYVIIDAAMKCLQKEESDVSALMMEKQAIIMRITEMAAHRDAGSPATVADVSRNGMGNGSGSWNWEV